MPSLLTTIEIREHIDTDLSDAALQRLIDDAEAEIVQRFGAHAESGTVTERFVAVSGERYWFPSRKINAAAAMTITRSLIGSTEESTALATEYTLDDPLRLRLLSTYDWAGHLVEVTYTPLTDAPRRKRVLIDLVRLALRYEAASSTRMGDASVNHVGYEQERESLLRRLSTGVGGFA